MKLLYPAIITQDKRDDRYLVHFVDLEEAITEGETMEEALFNASEVLTLTLEARTDEQLEIPLPSKCKSAYYFIPSASSAFSVM